MDNDFDWEYLAKQFQQEDAMMKVVAMIGKAQGSYYNALIAEGLPPLAALKIVTITISEVAKFGRETVPVLVQQFIDYDKGQE
jgi:hypothetical protein